MGNAPVAIAPASRVTGWIEFMIVPLVGYCCLLPITPSIQTVFPPCTAREGLNNAHRVSRGVFRPSLNQVGTYIVVGSCQFSMNRFIIGEKKQSGPVSLAKQGGGKAGVFNCFAVAKRLNHAISMQPFTMRCG